MRLNSSREFQLRSLRSRLLLVSLLVLLLSTPARSQSADFTLPDSSAVAVQSPANPNRTFFRDYHELSLYVGQSFGYPLILSDLPSQRLMIIDARLTSHFIEFRHTTLNYNFDVKPLALFQ